MEKQTGEKVTITGGFIGETYARRRNRQLMADNALLQAKNTKLENEVKELKIPKPIPTLFDKVKVYFGFKQTQQ